jgi:hypothetical protein
LPHAYQDPYHYHLYAPLRWWKEGRIFFASDYPTLFSANYWEHLHIWSLALFHGQATQILSVQIFGQLLHTVLGLGIFVWAFYLVLKEYGFSHILGWVCALVAASIPLILWTSWHAKNDYGGFFWVFTSLLLWQQYLKQSTVRSRFSSVFLIGICLGVGIYSKYTLVFFVAPFLLLSLIAVPQITLVLILGIGISFLPIALRNYIFTHNPVYPFLGDLFGSNALLPPTVLSIFPDKIGLGSGHAFNDCLLALQTILMHEPVLFASLFAPLLLTLAKQRGRYITLFRLGALPFLSVLMIVLVMGLSAANFTQMRVLAPAVFVSYALLFAALDLVLDRLGEKRVYVYLGILILAFLRPSTPWIWLRTFSINPNFFSLVRNQIPAGYCKVWALTELKNDPGKIVSIHEDAMYIMPIGKFYSAFQTPHLDRAVQESKSQKDFLDSMRAFGIRYIIHNMYTDVLPYYEQSYSIWVWLYNRQKDAILYLGPDCLVADLNKVK